MKRRAAKKDLEQQLRIEYVALAAVRRWPRNL